MKRSGYFTFTCLPKHDNACQRSKNFGACPRGREDHVSSPIRVTSRGDIKNRLTESYKKISRQPLPSYDKTGLRKQKKSNYNRTVIVIVI